MRKQVLEVFGLISLAIAIAVGVYFLAMGTRTPIVPTKTFPTVSVESPLSPALPSKAEVKRQPRSGVTAQKNFNGVLNVDSSVSSVLQLIRDPKNTLQRKELVAQEGF